MLLGKFFSSTSPNLQGEKSKMNKRNEKISDRCTHHIQSEDPSNPAPSGPAKELASTTSRLRRDSPQQPSFCVGAFPRSFAAASQASEEQQRSANADKWTLVSTEPGIEAKEGNDHPHRRQQNASPNKRDVDFGAYPRRRVALLFLYLGWRHDGLVTQPNTENTVEEHLFRALLKTRLIESRAAALWTRCGRTDRGVSAFQQVASLIIRSTDDPDAEGVFWPLRANEPSQRRGHSATNNKGESPIVRMLNACLPRSIRVLAWAPVHRDFNARFQCTQRTYTYVFPRASIDVKRMNDACALLIGVHDFRNFCHIDASERRLEMCYERELFEARVEALDSTDGATNSAAASTPAAEDPYALLRLTIRASSFLWHQIRCVVAVLYEIGAGRESPEVISELLDVDKHPARPQYPLANALPLCLFDCSFNGAVGASDAASNSAGGTAPTADLQWRFEAALIHEIVEDLQRSWAEHAVKAAIVRSMLAGIAGGGERFGAPTPSTRGGGATTTITRGLERFTTAHPIPKNYVRMLKRPTCKSLDERLALKQRKKDEEPQQTPERQ